MAQNAHKYLTVTGIITKRKSTKLIGVTIGKSGAGYKLQIFNNNDVSGNPIYTVDASSANPHMDLNLNCDQGLYGTITTGGEYNIIFN